MVLFCHSGVQTNDLHLFVSHTEQTPLTQFTVLKFVATVASATTSSTTADSTTTSSAATAAPHRNVLVIPFPKPRDEHARLVRIGEITSHYPKLFETLQEMFESPTAAEASATSAVSTTTTTTTTEQRAVPAHVHVCLNYASLLDYKGHGFELSATMRSLFAVRLLVSLRIPFADVHFFRCQHFYEIDYSFILVAFEFNKPNVPYLVEISFSFPLTHENLDSLYVPTLTRRQSKNGTTDQETIIVRRQFIITNSNNKVYSF
jgi:hypothetical protein